MFFFFKKSKVGEGGGFGFNKMQCEGSIPSRLDVMATHPPAC